MTASTPSPVFVRMSQTKTVLGVSDDQIRIWEKKGLIEIHQKGRKSFVRTEDVTRFIEERLQPPVGHLAHKREN